MGTTRIRPLTALRVPHLPASSCCCSIAGWRQHRPGGSRDEFNCGALGARAWDVARMVLQEAMLMAVLAVSTGWGGRACLHAGAAKSSFRRVPRRSWHVGGGFLRRACGSGGVRISPGVAGDEGGSHGCAVLRVNSGAERPAAVAAAHPWSAGSVTNEAVESDASVGAKPKIRSGEKGGPKAGECREGTCTCGRLAAHPWQV